MNDRKKLKVAVLFGGRSAEHEVSLRSAGNIIVAMNKEKYDPILIGIDRQGCWHLNEAALPLLHDEKPDLKKLNANRIMLAPDSQQGELVDVSSRQPLGHIDVLFPVLHGPYGEDGSVQGLAQLANVPCVGAGILGSAVGMDKDVAKRLLAAENIPVAPFVTLRRHQRHSPDLDGIEKNLTYPLFVKPANMGSSVGVTQAHDREQLATAIDHAFDFDTKVIVEETIDGREIECSVLGNDDLRASIPGEIIPTSGF